MRAYLDHHATTPLCEAARDAVSAWLAGSHGNPSSVHTSGRLARAALEDARATLAKAISAAPRELVFTSGGTESVHLAIGGVGDASEVSLVVCDPGAHPCVRAACEALAARRGVDFAWAPSGAEAEGALDAEALAAMLRPGALLAVSAVQHETGAIADLSAVHRVALSAGAVWIVDAAQALGKVALDAPSLGAAAVTLSGHKIGAPAGIGALWLRAGERIVQRMTGGGQERGVRAGTENLLGALAFGAAAGALGGRLAARGDVATRRDLIERTLLACGGVRINGATRERVASACHGSVEGVDGHELVAALDLDGVEVSSSAACSSGKAEPSETMRRMYPAEAWRARSALRVTLGPETSDEEVARACRVLPRVIARLRRA